MFANPEHTHKKAPLFVDAAVFEGDDPVLISVLRPAIMNDTDNPPKTLVCFDYYLVPVEDYKRGEQWRRKYYDLHASVALTPEDVMALIRHLNKLLRDIFNDHSYLSETVHQRREIVSNEVEHEKEIQRMVESDRKKESKKRKTKTKKAGK